MADKKDLQNEEQNDQPVPAESAEPVTEATVPEVELTVEQDAPTPEAHDGESRSADDQSELLAKLDAVTAEANEHRDRYLRSVAELENFRRRAVREKDEVRKYANQSLLEEFLPLLDNLKLGLQSAQQHAEGKVFADGFAMVVSQLEKWLENHGVETIDPEGQPFDPNFHESVAHQPHPELDEGHVISVQRVGYRLNDRLLRAAAVVVSSGAPEAAQEESS